MPIKKKSKQPSTVLTVDIGNTTVSFVLFRNQKPIRFARVHAPRFSERTCPPFVSKRNSIDAVVVCSVAPRTTAHVSSVLRKKINAPIQILGQHFRVPVGNLTRTPNKVGQDRLVNALAAYRQSKRAAVVMDFGTALTFDVIDPSGNFIGGIILPGIRLMLDSLHQKTAKLPKLSFTPTRSVLGKDTPSAIHAGCHIGVGLMCEAILRRLDKELKRKHVVFATGGEAPSFLPLISRPVSFRPHLTHEGIFQAFLTKKQPV